MWSKPGPSLTMVGNFFATSITNSKDGLSSLKSYLRLVNSFFGPSRSLLAGSMKAPSKFVRSSFVTSACSTVTLSKLARLYEAMAAVTSSSSKAETVRSRLAMARVSAPMPQPRSAMFVMPASLNRPACIAATLSLEACSNPASVKYIRLANSPNLAWARRLSLAWVSTVATSSAE